MPGLSVGGSQTVFAELLELIRQHSRYNFVIFSPDDGEYRDVSPKVIVTMIAAFLYLVKGKDLIPDSIPVIGIADDMTVFGLAFKFCKPEMDKFREYRDRKMSNREV